MRLKLIYVVIGSFLLIGDLLIAMLPKVVLLISVPQVIAAPSSELSLTKAFPHKKRSLAQFPAYVAYLKQMARQRGISEATIARAFANIYFVQRIVAADRRQPERRASVNLENYLQKVLPSSRISMAVQQYHNNKHQLDITSKRFGIPVQYIVALWGLESKFGQIQGQEDVIFALVTLSFDGRRERFFSKQLMAALKIMDNGYVPKNRRLKGSWAGAMGQTQFMPASFLLYAIDGSGNGQIDIWHNKADVFASIANYLKYEGWQTYLPWGTQVKLPAGFDIGLAGVKKNGKSIEQWKKLGVEVPVMANLASTTPTWLIIPKDPQGRIYLVTDNFRTIMHWNRSYYFSLSVCLMADGIAQQI
ncbi:MAG TPA: lytic transglycosylase domain-containing protein [Arsenophonus nasoniae]|uniref:lytic murein transglycosylase n=1 Tax=Arsenophonus nasoniae TaxID=638 RepID=UPI00387945BA